MVKPNHFPEYVFSLLSYLSSVLNIHTVLKLPKYRVFSGPNVGTYGLEKLRIWTIFTQWQKQPARGVLRKSCSENMQRIYRRTPMSKCDFNKVEENNFIELCNFATLLNLHFGMGFLLNFIKITLRHGCSPVNSLHIFWTTFPKNTFGRLLLNLCYILLNKPNKWCERSEACWNSKNLPFWRLFHSCKKLHYPNFHYNMFKLVSAIFINFLFFHQIALQKLWKMFFLSSKSSFRSRDVQFFVFFTCRPLLSRMIEDKS